MATCRLPCDLRGVESRGAAESHDGEFARVDPSLDRHQPYALGDGGADHLVHAIRGLHIGEVERPPHILRQGSPGGGGVEAGPAAKEVARIQVPQYQAGIGDGRPLPALAVAGRSGIRPGAFRADVEDTTFIDPRDAASTGAQGVDVDHRGGDLPPGLELLVGDVGNPVLDQRDVGAGAAHVEGDEFGFLQQLADVRGGADASRRAGQDRAHRHAAGVPYGGHSAVGLHDQHVLQLRVRLEPLSQVRQVAAEHRPDVGVDHRGAEAVKLLDLGNDLVGEGGVQVRETLANDFRSLLLVGGVEVGEQETDRQRLGALPDQVLQVFD